VDALIELGEEIRNGLGANSLKNAVDAIVLGVQESVDHEKTFALPSGVVIATWKNNALRFSNNIDFSQTELEKHLVQFFSKI